MKHGMPPIDWNEIEDRIRPHVKALRDAGYETTGSCGHDMWISLKIEPVDIPELGGILKRLGYVDFEITYTIHNGFDRWEAAKVQFGGDLAGDEKPFDLILLKVDPESHPLYFVLRYRRWPHTDGQDGCSDAYYFNEHTCPTNWIDDVVAVTSRGDQDPHGFATFVRRVPGDDIDRDNVDWSEVFPEIEE